MTSEVQVFAKDKITLNILQDILAGIVTVGFEQNNGIIIDYASQIHKDGKRVNVLGKFNISEDAKVGDTITIRPIMIDAPLTIHFHANSTFSGKLASVIRNSSKKKELEFEISSETSSLELIPQGKKCYLLKITNIGDIDVLPIRAPSSQAESVSESNVIPATDHDSTQISTGNRLDNNTERVNPASGDSRFASYELNPTASEDDFTKHQHLDPITGNNNFAEISSSDSSVQTTPASSSNEEDQDLRRIEQDIVAIERSHGQLSRKKQSAIDHLERIEAEYQKDYESYNKDIEDFKAQMEADESIIEYYKDQNVIPIETIFQEIRLKLTEAEKQISTFIEAKQRKTIEIENEIKSNKRH